MFSLGIFLAAAGITTLEMSEASAVGMALYADSHHIAIYVALCLGVLVILLPTALIGNFISIFPLFYVRVFSATFLLYFGLRLIRSSRRSVRYSLMPPGSSTAGHGASEHRSMAASAFSVGAVEAFEAAIVLVALLPNSFNSTIEGLGLGVVLVFVASIALGSKVRKMKQANIKIAVSALLLTFAVFWYAESVTQLNDILLLPIFLVFALVVYYIAHMGLHAAKAA